MEKLPLLILCQDNMTDFEQLPLFGLEKSKESKKKKFEDLYSFFHPYHLLDMKKVVLGDYVRTMDSVFIFSETRLLNSPSGTHTMVYITDYFSRKEKIVRIQDLILHGRTLSDILVQGDLIYCRGDNGFPVTVFFDKTFRYRKSKRKKLYCHFKDGTYVVFDEKDLIAIKEAKHLKQALLLV